MDTTIHVAGNATRDPELRFTQSGVAVCTLNLACNNRIKGADGEWKDDEPVFIAVTAWRQLGENVAASVKKGDRVMVTGPLKLRKWEKEDGTKGSSLEMTADDVACSFKWATGEMQRTNRSSSGGVSTSHQEAPPPEEPF